MDFIEAEWFSFELFLFVAAILAGIFVPQTPLGGFVFASSDAHQTLLRTFWLSAQTIHAVHMKRNDRIKYILQQIKRK